MEHLKFKVIGSSPLMLNSTASVDPRGAWAKELSKYTSKRKKTDEDHAEIERIKWYSSIAGYYDQKDGICIPHSMVFASIQDAAKLTRDGKNIERGVVVDVSSVNRLEYGGPRDIDKLWGKKKFVDTRVAGVKKSKIMVTRPIFREWSFEASVFVSEQIIDADDVKKIIVNAGKFCGIGTYRKIFGRFDVEFI